MCEPIYGTLMRYNTETTEFEPALAESLETQNGKKWILKLREGTTFSDGTPFDAEAIDFNWKQQSDPTMGAAGFTLLSTMAWKVIDPLTVQINLKKANYLLPWGMQYSIGFIGSPTALQAQADNPDPVGAGPFILDSHRQDSELAFSANPDYIEEGLPRLDSLTLKIIPADDQRVNALRSGEINADATYLESDATTLEDEGYQVLRTPLWGGTGVAFNFEDPVLSDPDLRAALLAAINVEQIAAAAYPGSTPPDHFYKADSPYLDASQGAFPAFDLTEAQQLFDAYLAKVGKSSLDLTISVYAEYPILTQGAQLVQAQLNELEGLNVKIEQFEVTEMYGRLLEGNFQLAISANQSQDPTIMYDSFHSNGTLNFSNYSNPKVDAALDTIRSTDDPDELTQAWTVVGTELSVDSPLRLYVAEDDILITPENVQDLNPVSVGALSYELASVD